MSTYTLDVHIDTNQFPVLKGSHYKLCVAKKVNGVYTVVWHGEDFLQNDHFTWTDEYQVFGQQGFTTGALVSEATDAQNIKYGQTADLDVEGQLHPATGTADNSGKFHVTNHFGEMNIGVNARLGTKFLPIFVSPEVVSGTIDLEPVVAVKVWFDLHLVTSSIILDAAADAIEVDYTGTTSQKIKYTGSKPGLGGWQLLDPSA